MPIIKSAAKRMRQNNKRAGLNASYKRKVRTKTKEFINQVQKNDSSQAENSLKEAVSAIDKAAKRGIMHKNTAARRKSRLNRLYEQSFSKTKKSTVKKPAATKSSGQKQTTSPKTGKTQASKTKKS